MISSCCRSILDDLEFLMHLKKTRFADACGYLWNPAEALPRRISSQDLQAVVGGWQSGAISRDTMFELFRSGEILPDGRTNQDEAALVSTGGNGEGQRTANGD
jgi:hypothetical protein